MEHITPTHTDLSSGQQKKDFGMFFEKLSLFFVFLSVFLLPIFFLPFSFVSTQFSTSLLFIYSTIIALFAYIAAMLVRGSVWLPHINKKTFSLFMLVPIVYLLAGISNGFSRMTFFGYTLDSNTVVFMVLAFVYMFLVSVSFKNKNRLFAVYFTFIISSLVFALFLLIRLVFGVETLQFGIFTRLIDTPVGVWNNVGIFFGISTLLSIITTEVLRTSKIMKVILAVALVVSLFFQVLVNNTSLWIVLAVFAGLIGLYHFFYRTQQVEHTTFLQKMSRIPWYTLSVFVISLFFVFFGGQYKAAISETFGISYLEAHPSFATTFEIAKNTLRSEPLFGSGPNGFLNQWLSFKPDDVTSSVFWNTDFSYGIGLIPTFAVTTGLLGLLSWVIFFGLIIFFGSKVLFRREGDVEMTYFTLSSFFVSLFLWTMSVIYVPSTAIFILGLLFTGLFIASLMSHAVIPSTTHFFNQSPIRGYTTSIVCIGVFLLGIYVSYGVYKNFASLWYFQKASMLVESDLEGSIVHIKKAIDMVPQDVYYRGLTEAYTRKLDAILAQDVNKVGREKIATDFRDTLSEAISAAIKAKDVDPTNYINWVALGRVYEIGAIPQINIEGAYELAALSYAEAVKRNPKNPALFIILSRLALLKNDIVTARSYAMQAVTMKRNYSDGYFLLAQIEIAANNVAGAIDATTAATIVNPNDAGAFFQLGLLRFNNKDYAGAITDLEKAIAIEPNFANAKYYLGISYALTGSREKAIKEFTDLQKTNPDNAEITSILQTLTSPAPVTPTTTSGSINKNSKPPVKENR